MAEVTRKQTPYEFLARWDKDGKLAGAHVGYLTRTFVDGVEIACTPDQVMPVAIGMTQGFPLTDVLNQLQIDALAALDHQRVEYEQQIAAMAAQIAELQAKVPQA